MFARIEAVRSADPRSNRFAPLFRHSWKERKTLAPAWAIALAAFCLATIASSAHAWSTSPLINNPVCTAVNNQDFPKGVASDTGSCIIVWQDHRAATWDIYAMRLQEDGTPYPGWTSNGNPVCTAAGDQTGPVVVSDNAGGVIVTWTHNGTDIYCNRIDKFGTTIWAGSATLGLLVCNAAGAQGSPDICRDGTAIPCGAIITWEDLRGASRDIYAQRITAAGAAGWLANGIPVCTASGHQSGPVIVEDWAGGACIAWADARDTVSTQLDIYAQRVDGSGTLMWGAVNVGLLVCNAANDQKAPVIVSNNSSYAVNNGAIVAWQDRRSTSSYDIYASDLDGPTGANLWTAGGTLVCNATNDQIGPRAVPDGENGVLLAWTDYQNGALNPDVYAQRVRSGGVLAWPSGTGGTQVCNDGSAQILSNVSADCVAPPNQGMYLAWVDSRYGPAGDVFSGRLNGAGGIPAGWTIAGLPVSTVANGQIRPFVFNDRTSYGRGIYVWADGRTGGVPDIYAQRVTCPGMLGQAKPGNLDAADIPNDQGGKVLLRWTKSESDAFYLNILGVDLKLRTISYSIFREVPAASAQQAIAHGTKLIDGNCGCGGSVASARALLRTRSAQSEAGQYFDIFWEYVKSVPAQGLDGYSAVVPTESDSVGGSDPLYWFMVAAVDSGGNLDPSDPVSGHSVDNLAPLAPAPFIGNSGGSYTALHWRPSTEGDFAKYRLYRGDNEAFVPGPSNLVTEKPDTGYVDNVSGGHYYKLAAVDIHGNQGAFASLSPAEVGGVAGPQPGLAWLGPASPNPFRVSTAIRFRVPASADVKLGVYDAQGRLVRELLREPMRAGEFTTRWDGRDGAAKPAPTGLYFYRLAIDGRSWTGRVLLTR